MKRRPVKSPGYTIRQLNALASDNRVLAHVWGDEYLTISSISRMVRGDYMSEAGIYDIEEGSPDKETDKVWVVRTTHTMYDLFLLDEVEIMVAAPVRIKS